MSYKTSCRLFLKKDIGELSSKNQFINTSDQEGEKFFMIFSGEIEIIKKTDTYETLIKELKENDSFCAFELFYEFSRDCHFRAKTECILFSFDKENLIFVKAMNQAKKRKLVFEAVSSLEFFSHLDLEERNRIVDVMQERKFESEEVVQKQAEIIEFMWVVVEGEVEVSQSNGILSLKGFESEVKTLRKKAIFGEKALFNFSKTAANFKVKSETALLFGLTKKSLEKVLASMKEILKMRVDIFEKYDEKVKIC